MVGVLALGYNLRGAITSLPPVFPELQASLRLSGATISLTGFLAAAYGGFRKPGRALVAGLFIGVLEAMLGGYVSAQYGDTVLYAILAALILAWPRGLGFESAVSG